MKCLVLLIAFSHVSVSNNASRNEWQVCIYLLAELITPFAGLDATVQRLLDLLQTDASGSNQALAAAAGVSPATAQRRVKRLVAAGVIARQVALVTPPPGREGVTALVEVTLDRQGAEHLDAFERKAVAEVAVQQCYRVSPGPDVVLVLWLRDLPAYAAFAQRVFTQDANVRNVKTFFSVSRAKFDPRIAARDLA